MSNALTTSLGHATSRQLIAKRSFSSDSLDSIGSGGSYVRGRDATARAYAKAPPVSNKDKDKMVSRLDLLLVPKKAKIAFTPGDDTAMSQKVNKAIKMSSQWTDVQTAIMDTPALSASNAAFALYRLGCLNSFASQKRQAELRSSGFMSALWTVAMSKLRTMDIGSLVLVLDGCARLQYSAPLLDLDNIADRIAAHVHSLDATQLALVMWAFHKLAYVPRNSILVELEHSVSDLACDMSAQGLCLTLSGFHAAGFVLNARTLHRLAHFIHCKLPLFKLSDLATCLDCFAAYNFQPSSSFLEVVKGYSKRNVNASRVSGKGSLADAALTAYKRNSGYASS